MELVYVRTDKNGTKYFHDWTCPRCGGAGQSDKWAYTGKVCFACGGSGKRAVAKIVKEYTPEYAAKMSAKRLAKIDMTKKLAAPSEEKLRKWKEEHCKWLFAQNGCGEDGVGYVLVGDTYPIKNQIKAAGGKWILGCWVSPVDFKVPGVRSKQIRLECFENGELKDPDIIWNTRNELEC